MKTTTRSHLLCLGFLAAMPIARGGTIAGSPPVAVPEIAVEQPVGNDLDDGDNKISFGIVKMSKTRAVIFTIRNIGNKNLTGLSLKLDGMNPGDFVVKPLTKTKLTPDTSTTFKVIFKPTATGTRNGKIHIKSNDADENPFDIRVSGFGKKP
ncbi:MAG: choice-of-anchor D domain-containing protein [Luteolibacter sp.]